MTSARNRDDRPADSPSTARNALVIATAIRPGSKSAMLPLRRSTVMPVGGRCGEGGTSVVDGPGMAWIVLGVMLSPREPVPGIARFRGALKQRVQGGCVVDPKGSRGSHRPSLGVAQ